MKKILLDASSAVLLFKAGLLKDLIRVYRVFITEAVFHELTGRQRHGTGMFLHYISLQEIRVIAEENISSCSNSIVTSTRHLHRGERDTIRKFESGDYDFIVIDDGRAARFCKENGLPFINALLFPCILKVAGRISELECSDKMDEIVRLGRYSLEVVEWARGCCKESLSFAIPDIGDWLHE